MTASNKIEQYVQQISPLSLNAINDSQQMPQLLQFIDLQIQAKHENKLEEHFFQAEFAFYNKEYEKALKLYLLARSVPHFQFYCFRASAYISLRRGHHDKALNFAKKALSIFSDDPMTKSLLETLEEPQAQATKHNTVTAKMAIGRKEIEELAHIFQENEPKEELFACEFETSSSVSSPIHVTEAKLEDSNAIRPESSMNMDFFSSFKPLDTPVDDTLTHRLYALEKQNEREKGQSMHIQSNSPNVILEELKKIALKEKEELPKQTPRFAIPGQKPEKKTEELLHDRIMRFKESQSELLKNYDAEGKSRSSLPNDCLYILQGWDPSLSQDTSLITSRALLTDHARKTSGGFFLRWNGKGIAVNPGENFLRNFHEQGLHIKDIDFVIVTRDVPEMYADVKEIYHLNTQLNKISPEFQLIHYYLNPKSYQHLSPILKPNFKQERHTVLPLELFLDSPDVEKIELTPEISLHYFPSSRQESYHTGISQPETRNTKTPSALGIKLELKSISGQTTPYDKSTIRLGYLSGAGWTPLLSHYLGSCDILITEFGNTSSSDYGKMKYNEDTLGYFGTITLLEEIHPKLLLTTEFGGREGDIRLEAVQKIRADHLQNKSQGMPQTTALPADRGLFVDLKNFKIQCSLTKVFVDPQEVMVVKSADAFGKLNYLAPHCCM